MAEAIPDLDDTPRSRMPADPLGRFLYAWSLLSALGGILLLLAVCVLSVQSVLGRWLWDEPVLGDVEMVQMACAMAIAACLPWTQMRRAHVMVDFFTLSVAPRVRRRMDQVAALLLALVAAVVAWRSVVGGLEAAASGESTMILGWPLWWSYLTIGPGFGLLSLTALYSAWQFGKPEGVPPQ